MAKITRFTQKIFGYTAGVNQVGVFGSLAAGSLAYSTDPAAIQALPNWQEGWFAAIVASNSPAIEDVNAIEYVFSSQLAYLGQTGVSEWIADTTYFIGSIAQDGNGALYKSIVDNNTANALTDGTKWVRGLPGMVPVGGIVPTFPNLTGAYSTTATTVADAMGYVLCGGQTLADSSSPMNGQTIPNINNSVFLQGSGTAGGSGGSNGLVIAHTHTWSSATSLATGSHTHNYAHVHGALYVDSTSTNYGYALAGQDNTITTIGIGNTLVWQRNATTDSAGSGSGILIDGHTGILYTTGVVDNAGSGSGASANTAAPSATTTVSGTTGSAGSGADSRPFFINTVYLMRVR